MPSPDVACPPRAAWAPDPGERPSLLAPSVRRRVIDVLAAAPRRSDGSVVPRSAQEVATALDVHVSTARAHLEVLVDAHVVEAASERTGQVGRPRKVYRLVADGVRLHPHHRELSRLVTSHWGLPEPEGSALMEPAARAWAVDHVDATRAPWAPAATPGQWLSTAELAVEALEPLGFRHEIALADGGRRVDLTLTAAPFLAIAARHAPVLYAFRRGLLAGTLELLGETDVRVVLTPHDDLAVTTAHLETTTPLRRTVHTFPPSPHQSERAAPGRSRRPSRSSQPRTTTLRRDA